MTQAERFLF